MLLQHFEPQIKEARVIDNWHIYIGDDKVINFDGQLGANITGFKTLENSFHNVPAHLTQTVENNLVGEIGEKLQVLTGKENFFLTTTGTSAVDSLVRWCQQENRSLYYLEDSFHGRGTHLFYGKSLTYEEFYNRSWAETDVFLYEPIKGGYGKIKIHPESFFQALKVIDKSKTITVADEIQFGFYHTGHLWGHEEYGLLPDVILFGKGIAQQVPVAGFVTDLEIIPEWSSTFSHYPIGLIAARDSLDFYIRNHLELISKTRRMQKRLLEILPSDSVVIGASFYFEHDTADQQKFIKEGVYINNYHGSNSFKGHIPPAIPYAISEEGIKMMGKVFNRWRSYE